MRGQNIFSSRNMENISKIIPITPSHLEHCVQNWCPLLSVAENAVSQGTHVQKTEVAGLSDFSDATEIFNTDG